MRLLIAFLKMIRLPNLIFIALTQLLFQFCIYLPLYKDSVPGDDGWRFILLLFASLFIAAAGYIINDYFDINIDQVNKPQRMVVDKVISRRWAIAWHFMLSASGILLTFFAVPFLSKWYLILGNIACVALLWLYSTNFKKSLLIGNVVISLLTAWTILVLFLSKLSVADALGLGEQTHTRFFRLTFLYAGFAFIISLIREAVKDVEDMEGDARYGCRTMPIVLGVNATKIYTAVWLVVLLAILIIVQVYVLQFQWWAAIAYSGLLIIAPLLIILVRLFKATAAADFARLSAYTKAVMLTGILSMIFFYFYL